MTENKAIPAHPVVAIAGATGAVGREFLEVLHDLDFPACEVRALASHRSAGKKLPVQGVRAGGCRRTDGGGDDTRKFQGG